MTDQRLQNEIEHGKHIREAWDEFYYYWETPAGKVRWNRRVKMLTDHITPEMDVLEVGTGTGCFTKEIIKTKANIVSIDISPDLMEVAQKKIKAPNLTLKIENAYELTYPENSFDTIVGSSILHHLDIDKALAEFYRVLKPGGTIYFTEPNMRNPQIYLERNVDYIRKKLHASPDETAFIKGKITNQIASHKFQDIQVTNFDFLHPSTPKFMISFIDGLGRTLEKIPLIKAITGSLYIRAKK